jgi:hypothetical protein
MGRDSGVPLPCGQSDLGRGIDVSIFSPDLESVGQTWKRQLYIAASLRELRLKMPISQGAFFEAKRR